MADHATSDNPAVQAQLDRFAALSPGRDILGLDRISALLAVLGNPHENLPPVFHVAGTNGKGSTCAFLRAAMEAAGLTAHVYSSPHLVRFNERIRIAGKLIEDSALAPILAEVLDAAEAHEIGPSFFEATTAAALLAFSRISADACIIEVGLGGRLDATNIINSPLVCGIASLGIDHEAFLLAAEDGVPDDPLTRIGWEKAGIAKRNIPLVTVYPQEQALAGIERAVKETGAIHHQEGKQWKGWWTDSYIGYRDKHSDLRINRPNMAGDHQAHNALLAIAMIKAQSAISIPDAAFEAMAANMRWPGRLQKLGDGPLTRDLPKGTEIWLDGGHNPDAGRAISKWLGKYDNINVICAMLQNKDAKAFLKPFGDRIRHFCALPVVGHESWDVDELASFGHDLGAVSACGFDEISAALDSIISANYGRQQMGRHHPNSILICGSLYLAGQVLKLNEEYPT